MATYFSIFLVIGTIISGLVLLYDTKMLAPKRKLALEEANKSAATLSDDDRKVLKRKPVVTELADSVFLPLLIVTILRSFLYEPFTIPSGSMLPTLFVGDFIIVDKNVYGFRDPVFRKELIPMNKPQRGDIAVFKKPGEETTDYIKRVVGLPGDVVRYDNKRLYIKPSCDNSPDKCGHFLPIDMEFKATGEMYNAYGGPIQRFEEDLMGTKHMVFIDPLFKMTGNPFYGNPKKTLVPEFKVPAGQYFMVGDNRDNSEDSRYWGFVPEENFVGKAIYIWLSLDKSNDPNSSLNFFPFNIRFERLGSIQ